jgi:prepilin-type N-terminal cleavage/methylation domain-containing protein
MVFNNNMKKQGFSLIEFIIVIAIIGILVAIVVPSLSSFRNNQLLRGTTEELSGFIQEARSMTLSSHDSLQYGIHFEEDEAVRFSGTSYSAGAVDNEVFSIPQGMTISDISLFGAGDDVLFERLTGQTDEYGTITLTLTATSAERIITISALGIVDSN